jgi:hypothetical protein
MSPPKRNKQGILDFPSKITWDSLHFSNFQQEEPPKGSCVHLRLLVIGLSVKTYYYFEPLSIKFGVFICEMGIHIFQIILSTTKLLYGHFFLHAKANILKHIAQILPVLVSNYTFQHL